MLKNLANANKFMSMTNHIFVLIILFSCGATDLCAQMTNNQGGIGNTQNNYYNDNKKELNSLRHSNEQLLIEREKDRQLLDAISQQQKITNDRLNNADSMNQEMWKMLHAKLDTLITLHSSINARSKERESKIYTQSQQIAYLEKIISLQNKGNFAPFGIKQFKNNKDALGYTFLVSQVAVPVVLGVGFECASRRNYQRHKDRIAQTLEDHNNYYKNYEDYHNAAIYAPIISAIGIYFINVLCNRYFTKIEIKPETFSDPKGDLGMVGMSLGFKF